MIRIQRPPEAPEILRTHGKAEGTNLCNAHESGEREFTFKSAIYGDATVKAALIQAQHGKCAFCERYVGEDGDVEHFRPKAGCCQGKRTTMQRPGYYWLAYDWDNLLLACSACNSRNKRNLFPLADDTTRARCHTDDLTRESPLFINPAEEDPEALIGWRKEVAYPIKNDKRAKQTIEELGLNRPALIHSRRKAFEEIAKALPDIAAIAKAYPNEKGAQRMAERLHALISKHCKDEEEFAAMFRTALRDL
jgi:uncharacterized protein (TIGR02646 family)